MSDLPPDAGGSDGAPAFSDRVPYEPGSNPLTRALEARRSARLPILDLTGTNPTRAGFLYEEGPIREALSGAGVLRYDPDPRGGIEARRAVASYYRDDGLEVSPGQILLTASTSEAYGFLFKLLCNPGEGILVPRPSYPLFEHLAGLEAVEVHPYRTRYRTGEGWRIDLDDLARALGPRIRAVVLVHPHNPSGAYASAEELAAVDALCRGHGAALLVDEVFFDFPAPSHAEGRRRAASICRGLTFSLSGLSKVAALPQMKLGWIVVSGPQASQEEAVSRLEFVSDAYLSVGAGVQEGAPRLLSGRRAIQGRIRGRLEENERTLREVLGRFPGVRHRPRQGGWYAVLELPGHVSDEDAAVELVEREGVHVHPGYFYDFDEDHLLVLSLLTPPEAFRDGLGRLAARFSLPT